MKNHNKRRNRKRARGTATQAPAPPPSPGFSEEFTITACVACFNDAKLFDGMNQRDVRAHCRRVIESLKSEQENKGSFPDRVSHG